MSQRGEQESQREENRSQREIEENRSQRGEQGSHREENRSQREKERTGVTERGEQESEQRTIGRREQ